VERNQKLQRRRKELIQKDSLNNQLLLPFNLNYKDLKYNLKLEV
jgi:hypothetical protein